MEDKLFTQTDLAQRWQVSKTTIENWRKDGVIQPVKGIPAIRFSLPYILELEGVTLEQFSPLLKRKMERELKKLQEENKHLKGILSRILAETSQVIGI